MPPSFVVVLEFKLVFKMSTLKLLLFEDLLLLLYKYAHIWPLKKLTLPWLWFPLVSVEVTETFLAKRPVRTLPYLMNAFQLLAYIDVLM